jgi:hypothetical protein
MRRLAASLVGAWRTGGGGSVVVDAAVETRRVDIDRAARGPGVLGASRVLCGGQP